MKKIVVLVCVLLTTFCYSLDIEWKVVQDSKLYDENYVFVKDIQRNTIVIPRNPVISRGSGKMVASYDARIFFENQRYAIDAEAVIPNGTQDLLDENLLTPTVNRRGKTWFNAHSIPILQSKNRETARLFVKNMLEYLDKSIEGYWYEDSGSWRVGTSLFQIVLHIGDIQSRMAFYILNTKKEKKHYKIEVFCTSYSFFDSTIPIDQQPVEGEKTVLLLYPDGEYIDVYVKTTDNHLWSFVQVDEKYQKQFEKLIKTNTCDLSNITWPRRADKAHSVGATCVVAESLRLRKEENTSSATLQIMQPGTQVQIRQLGKKQTIDGISANWVQVQLADGTKGWCFGGWLVEK